MRKILQALRLPEQLGFNIRQIAEFIKASFTTVSCSRGRAKMASIEYTVAPDMSHEWVRECLFVNAIFAMPVNFGDCRQISSRLR